MNNWRESRFKAVCRVFSFCCGPTGPLVVIKGRMAVCGDAWSRTTLLKNQLLSFAKLSFALYPCRARHPRLSRRPSQAASTFFQTLIWLKLKMKKNLSFPRLGSSCSFIKTNKKLCNHNPISVIPRQAVCRRSAGVWQTTQTDAHQCATAPRLQPLSR